MKRTVLSLALGLVCLGVSAQSPDPSKGPSVQTQDESYFLTLRRSSTYPSMVVLEIYTSDTRALHVDQFRSPGGAIVGSLDVQGSDHPSDGRLARYEYRGDTEGDQVAMDVKLPNGSRLRINKTVGSSIEYMRLQSYPQQISGQTSGLVFHPIDSDPNSGGGGCPTGKVATNVSTVACGRSINITLCCTPPVVLTWDNSCNVTCQ